MALFVNRMAVAKTFEIYYCLSPRNRSQVGTWVKVEARTAEEAVAILVEDIREPIYVIEVQDYRSLNYNSSIPIQRIMELGRIQIINV